MKKHQVMLGGLFLALPFLVVSFLSRVVTPANFNPELQKAGNTCMREQPCTPGNRAKDCPILCETGGG